MKGEGKPRIENIIKVPHYLRGKEGFYTVSYRRRSKACLFFSAPPISDVARDTLTMAVRGKGQIELGISGRKRRKKGTILLILKF